MNRPASRGVMIMAGGTGGHIFPGLAVAESLRNQNVPVYWLGAMGAMECERVPANGIDFDTVQIGGLRGKGVLRWLSAPFELTRAVFQALKIFGRRRPACAVSFGGYAAGPGGLAAWLRGVPLLVHEQNRVPGLTNRILARLSRKVAQAFPDTWPPSPKVETCGNPVRSGVISLPAPTDRMSERTGPMRLLVTGGSQGARALNRALPEALKLLGSEARPIVRHQSGAADSESTRTAYEGIGADAEVTPFIENMAEAYGWADLVVCRSGALTVSEISAAGLAAVFIPFPFAVDDHQTRNAEFLRDVGAAEIIAESELTPAHLARVLGRLLRDRKKLLEMANSAHSVAVPDAADRVARICLELSE